jgi:mono/diheme cytochrome c family protein
MPATAFAPVVFCLCLVTAASSASANDSAYANVVQPFIKKHCLECHDASTARAGFRIDLLSADFEKSDAALLWKEVMDKINSNEMPPKKKPRPDANEAFAVATWVAAKLQETELAAQGAGGRVPVRRLNRVEYANTVRDLFSLEEGFARRLEKELPADGKVGGFDRGAAGLFMDEGQLSQYLMVADMLLGEVVFNEKPNTQKLVWDAKKEKHVHGIGAAYRDESGQIVDNNPPPEFVATLKEPLSMIPIDGFQQWNAKEKRYVPHGPFHWAVKRGGIEYLSGGNNYRRPGNLRSPFFAEQFAKKVVTRDGWYRVRVNAGAFRGEGKEQQKEVRLVFEYCYGSPLQVVQSVLIDAPLDQPKEYEFFVYLQSGPPDFNRNWKIGWDNGDQEVVRVNPKYWDVQWKPVTIAGEIARAIRDKKPDAEMESLRKKSEEAIAAALENRKTFNDEYYIWDPKLDIAKRPRLWVGEMSWEGPVVEWPSKGRRELLFAGEERNDDSYLREIFARFLPRAYRRPVTSDEVDRVVQWTLNTKAARNLSFVNAVREGVKNVLCSPAFLYVGAEGKPLALAAKPSPQPVDALQLASRLSYLLWSSTPDETLLKLAAADKLRDSAVLRAEVKRMIADPKASEFVRSFAGQWLGVRNFDNGNPPNPAVYNFYDQPLRESSKREPLEFFQTVLREDLSVLNFLNSDFLVINERLAKHYDIKDVEGEEFRRVPAPEDGRRGGVLGMSGILTYLADGTRTLPVRRATWVLDALWNQPTPAPPPNAGDLPVIKDKNLSVRARLEQHRQSENCASCHSRIDAFGLALENYDATGMWRDRQNGEGMRGNKNDPAIDVSGALPDGTEFTTLQEFKATLLTKKELFVRGLAEKLLCYALGRPIGYGDRQIVDQIVAHAAKHDYRLQEMIQATVASPFFLTQ